MCLKKYLVLLISLTVLTTGCGKKQEEEVVEVFGDEGSFEEVAGEEVYDMSLWGDNFSTEETTEFDDTTDIDDFLGTEESTDAWEEEEWFDESSTVIETTTMVDEGLTTTDETEGFDSLADLTLGGSVFETPTDFSYVSSVTNEPVEVHEHSWYEIGRKGGNNCEQETVITYECNCGAQKTDTQPAVGHSYTSTTVEATCSQEGAVKQVCERCGNIKTLSTTPMLAHKLQTKTLTEPTCDADGEKQTYCTVCSAITKVETIKALGHNWEVTKEGVACKEGASNTLTCSKCKETKSEAVTGTHSWSEWSTVRETTCVRDGSESRACSVCKAKETRTVDKLGHESGSWAITKEATCTDVGIRVKQCNNCEKVMVKETIPVIAHKFSAWTDSKVATCTSEGEKVRKCTSCGEEQYKTVDKIAHKLEWVPTIEATCTKKGREERKCSVCEEVVNERDVEMTEHELNSTPITTVNATCERDGYMRFKCKNCMHTEDLLLSATGHTFDYSLLKPACKTCGMPVPEEKEETATTSVE